MNELWSPFKSEIDRFIRKGANARDGVPSRKMSGVLNVRMHVVLGAGP